MESRCFSSRDFEHLRPGPRAEDLAYFRSEVLVKLVGDGRQILDDGKPRAPSHRPLLDYHGNASPVWSRIIEAKVGER